MKKPAVIKKELTREEIIEKAFKNKKSQFISEREDPLSIVTFPPDSRKYQIGNKVQIGHLEDPTIIAISDDYRFYVVEYMSRPRNSDPVLEIGCWVWTEVVRVDQIQETAFADERPSYLDRYVTSTLSNLLTKTMKNGFDANPDYQRDYVWTDSDRHKLLTSMFNGQDIGKFVLLDYNWPRTEIEILDGKQRLDAIIQFITSQYDYNGYYWHNLSMMDRYRFEDLRVQYVELNGNRLTEIDKIQIFLDVNVAGVPQSEEHIARLQDKLYNLKHNK